MNSALRSLFFGAACLTFALVSSGQNSKAEITSYYAKMAKAMMAKDMKTYFGFMTPDYKEKRPDRLLDLSYVREDITRYINFLKTVSVKREVKSVKPSGNAILAETGLKVSGTFQNQGQKRVHRMETIQTTRDTWVKTAKGWQIRNSVIVKHQVLVNGKPLSGSGMG